MKPTNKRKEKEEITKLNQAKKEKTDRTTNLSCLKSLLRGICSQSFLINMSYEFSIY